MSATLPLAVAAVALLVLASAPAARGAVGDLEITAFEVAPRANSIAPDPLQAGAHPDLRVLMRFCGSGEVPGSTGACTPPQSQAHLKDLHLRLPRGLWANPSFVPRCDPQVLVASGCAPDTVIGQLTVTLVLGTALIPLTTPLYNVETSGPELARIGTQALPGNPPTPLLISATADENNGERIVLNASEIPGPTAKVAEIEAVFNGVVAGRPFIANPASCGPATASLEVGSWETSSVVEGQSTFQPTGCEALPFDPTLTTSAQPLAEPGSGSEWVVAIQYPCADPTPTPTRACSEGYENEAIWHSQLRDITLTLPDGIGVAAAAAEGLEVCTPEQFRIERNEPVECPPGASLGSIRAESPVRTSRLEGRVFFGPPAAPGRPTRERPWNIFFLIEGDGLRVKLAGTLTLNEKGGVTIELRDLPMMPLSRLELRLTRGGVHGPILTGLACGEHSGDALLTDWVGRSVTRQPIVDVTSGCLSGAFEPIVEEVSVDPAQAGSSSSLRVVITRPDGQRLLKSVSLALPSGANATLADIERCPLSHARVGGCDEASRLGRIVTTVGSDDGFVALPGSVYLAAAAVPGDAATLATVTPVRVGPIDLGSMVILARATLRPSDGGIDIAFDLPFVFEGIPLLVRRIELVLDRQGVFSNPTGCEARSVGVSFKSDDGRAVDRGHPLSMTGCGALPFAPKVRLVTGERDATGAGSHPPLRAIISQPGGGSAIKKAVIAIPALGMDVSQFDRPEAVCRSPTLTTRDCPPRSHVGAVKVDTPLLSFPLSGPVFAVPEPGNPLPGLGIVLHGGGLVLGLRARNSLQGTTFEALPDIPITRLKLRINGGREGMLTAFSDLCGRRPPAAESAFTSQAGRIVPVRPGVVVNGCLKRATVIVDRRVRVFRDRTFGVRLLCRRRDRCDGRLSVRALKATRSPMTKRGAPLAGTKSFRIPAGRSRQIRMRLTPAGWSLRRKGHLLADASARVGNSVASRKIDLVGAGKPGARALSGEPPGATE